MITDIQFDGWSLSHKGFMSFSWSRQSDKKWFKALLTPMSFAAQRTPLVPHEETRLNGSYLSKMSQVDFLIMNNMLEVKALSVASKASWVREFPFDRFCFQLMNDEYKNNKKRGLAEYIIIGN